MDSEQKPSRYKTALEIQDACNLTAVVGELHKVCLEVLHEHNSDTDSVLKDPAVLLIIDKIYDMVGRPEDSGTFSKIYLACCNLAGIVIENEVAYEG